MITGAIAVLILVVVLPAAANEGNWGTFWVGVVIAGLVLVFGAISRRDDRAYNNIMHYWATGERPEDRNRRQRARKSGWVGSEPFGTVSKKSTTAKWNWSERCAGCGARLKEVSRPTYGNAKFVVYECPACGERKLVKMG